MKNKNNKGCFQKGHVSHNKGKTKGNYEPLMKTSKKLKEQYKLGIAKCGMTGKHHTEESKRKSSKSNTGQTRSEETRRNISKSIMGHISHTKGLTKENSKGLKKVSESLMGHKNFNVELKGCFKKGHIPTGGFNINPPKMEKNWNWRGGKSFEPYGIEFNKELKEYIRNKYNFRCQECFRHQDELYYKSGRKYKLMIHHIDYDKRNNNENNLIPLCVSCHGQTQFNRDDWTDYYQGKVS